MKHFTLKNQSASIFLLLFTLSWVSNAAATIATVSHVNVHPLYIEESTNSDTTFQTLRDKDGFLWIATDNGLKRYDGYHLKTFTGDKNKKNSIGSSNITALLLQKSGSLWAAGNTLNLYHPETETFSTYNISNQLTIKALHEDSRGILWLAGEGFGLVGFDLNNKQVLHTYFKKDNTRFISSITTQTETDFIWLSTNTGLYRFNTKTHNHTLFELPLNYKVLNNVIRSTTIDKNGDLWLATHQGLITLNPNTKKHKQYIASPNTPGALKSNTLRSVFSDNKGEIWIGTDKKGLHKYLPSTDNFLHFPSSPSNNLRFPPTSINNIYEDDENTLWFSVGVSGVYRMTEHLEKFQTFQSSSKHNNEMNHLSYNNVLDLLEDKKGHIWIATDGGGLNKYNPKTQIFTHYKHNPDDPNSISGDDVLSLAEDENGYIWAGTWEAGLNRLNPETGQFTRFKYNQKKPKNQTLSNNNIFRIKIDPTGKIYLSLWSKGLQIYDPKTQNFESFSPLDNRKKSNISNLSIYDFLATPDGKYWITGHSGLELFDPTSKSFSKIDIPDADVIYDAHLDKNGTVWLASSKSLIRYHPTTNITKSYTTKDGLSDSFVVSIEEDEQGNLWLGTRRGLNRFSPTTEEFTTFTEKDGLAGSQFNHYSHLKTKDGFMYFGSKQGLSVFKPNHLPVNNTAPQIHLTSFEIFQKPVIPNESPWLKNHINLTDKIELPYDKKDILFEFTALNFISPSKNRYKYKLKGLEDSWIQANSNQRRVRYTNLAPGEYTFQVLGSNNEDLWNGSAKEVQLTILPPWWETWWARSTYAILFFGIIYAFIFWQLRITRIHQRELEVLVKQRTQELKQANNSVKQLNSELEQRVNHRTQELSNEIEERKYAEERSSHLAFHDPLTGLPNRSWLLQHLQGLIHQGANTDIHFALLFIGGDRFKQINDTHGHLLGDMLLISASQRLSQLLPKPYHCIRLGSDEFTVVIDNNRSEEEVIKAAEKILKCFQEPFVFEQAKMNFNVSIGMLICSNEYSHPTQILRNVDIAMNHAKSRGRGTYQMFDDTILKQTLDSASLQADLLQALKLKQFEVMYQPIITINTGALSGFETLLRWRHPKRGMISPEKFIPIAEELGIIFDIGLWVLEQASIQLYDWRRLVSEDTLLPTVAVNLSPLQLKQADLLDKFDEIFSKIGPIKTKIKLEITESALMENTRSVDHLLDSLRQRGIELAIDDFGTGYSSLSYLDKLPVQVLKIDQSFVNALFDDENATDGAHEIVRATIALAHNLKMRVVAEGIETQAQMDVLKSYQCDYGQGYLISRPLTPKKANEYLVKNLPPKK